MTMVTRFTNNLRRRQNYKAINGRMIKVASARRVNGCLVIQNHNNESTTSKDSPLPGNGEVLRRAVIMCLFGKHARLRSFFVTVFLGTKRRYNFPFRRFRLRILGPFTILQDERFPRRELITSIFRPMTRQDCVERKGVRIIQVRDTMRRNDLPTLTSTNHGPFTKVSTFGNITSNIRIIYKVLNNRMLPIFKLENKFRRVAMFRGGRINVRRLQGFLTVLKIRNVNNSVTFNCGRHKAIRTSIKSGRALTRATLFKAAIIRQLNRVNCVLLKRPNKLRQANFHGNKGPARFLLRVNLYQNNDHGRRRNGRRRHYVMIAWVLRSSEVILSSKRE